MGVWYECSELIYLGKLSRLTVMNGRQSWKDKEGGTFEPVTES